MSLPSAAPVTGLLDAFRASKVMFTALRLGLFDVLVEGPQPLSTLSRRLECSLDGLERLADACRPLGLLEKTGDTYALTEVSRVYLVQSSPHTMAGYILYSDEVLWQLWAHLADAVRQGSHVWKQAYGSDEPIFNQFFRTEERKRIFLRGMHGFGVLSSPRLVRAFNLSRFRKIADLGGATGHLVVAACEAYPDLTGTVFDLPAVIPAAREYCGHSLAAARITFAEGDFFEDPLPEADLYAVGRILHDWSEPKIKKLLKRIFTALPSGGALLIGEKILYEDKSGPPVAHFQSLNMLTCTEGKERTLGEYRALLEEAGFAKVEGRFTGRPLDAVLASKG